MPDADSTDSVEPVAEQLRKVAGELRRLGAEDLTHQRRDLCAHLDVLALQAEQEVGIDERHERIVDAARAALTALELDAPAQAVTALRVALEA